MGNILNLAPMTYVAVFALVLLALYAKNNLLPMIGVNL